MRALLAAALFVLAGAAVAQTLYKWTDKDGRVHFGDKPPAGFQGEVTRIEPDVYPAQAPRPAPKPAPKTEREPEGKAPDTATRRRRDREQLAAAVAAARVKVEAARKALTDGEDPQDDEKQFVQERFARDQRRPERTPAPRSNCISQQSADGKPIWNCARPIPGEAYYSRQLRLEEDLRKAEEELTEAERAYRRGVD